MFLKISSFVRQNYLFMEVGLIVIIVFSAYMLNTKVYAVHINDSQTPLGDYGMYDMATQAPDYRFTYEKVSYVAVLEKATDHYYVYNGAVCLGYVDLDKGNDIRSLSGEDIMARLVALGNVG
ncbi:MAG: hypothetical protein FWF44_10535 [Defluviitaleaceae bacterium]|nr:hypothetical protein [Defluviitaleaceae bacterium]